MYYIKMIRNIKELKTGKYIADFRIDEGVRVREEFICPTLLSTNTMKDLSRAFLLIEVIEDVEDKTSNE